MTEGVRLHLLQVLFGCFSLGSSIYETALYTMLQQTFFFKVAVWCND
jgi:hypothetical protein